MKTKDYYRKKMVKQVESYNKLARKWGYRTLHFDIRKQMMKGACVVESGVMEDKKYVIQNIIEIIKDIYIEHKHKKIMQLNRLMRLAEE